MKERRIVDLSVELHPGNEESELYIKTYSTHELMPRFRSKKESWYIIQRVSFYDHIGTHIESPYHCIKTGKDVSKIPLEHLVGEAVILDFTHKKPGEEIGIHDLEKNSDWIHSGDIVFIKTGYDKYTGLFGEHERPFLSSRAVEWLVEKGIHCLGIDASGIEDQRAVDGLQQNHRILFEKGIPLVEQLSNLNRLRKRRVIVYILPLRISGLGASPVRVIAIEEKEN